MPFSVLMVCTGNICRSPMAEGLLRHHLPEFLKDQVSVSSAGTYGLHGNFAEPFAVRASAFHGADISDHRARMLDAKMVKDADLVLVMENLHLKQINSMFFFRCSHVRLLRFFSTDPADLEVSDPYGRAYAAYEETARTLIDCLPGVINHIRGQLSCAPPIR